MQQAAKNRVDELDSEVLVVGTLVDSLLLVAADMNAPHEVFNAKFKEVQETINSLRSKHLQLSLADAMVMVAGVKMKANVGRPIAIASPPETEQ